MTDDDTPQDPSHGPGPARARVVLPDAGQLCAAVPHLLGFYPTDSLILLVLDGTRLVTTVRLDLPDPRQCEHIAGQLPDAVLRYGRVGIVGLIVGDDLGPDGSTSRGAFATHVTSAFARCGLVAHVYGVPGIAEGARWFAYSRPGDTGTVPNPADSPLHAEAVGMGLVTLPDRESLVALVRPDPDDVLDRRSRLMDALADRPEPDLTIEETERRFQLVRRQVERSATRVGPLTDGEVAELGHTLADRYVRDWCLEFAIGPHAVAAERLWTELTRQCPAPECAEPATLLACCAYIRGDGALAHIALDRAQDAVPDHRLAGLVRTALDHGMPPASVLHLARRCADRHRADLDRPLPGRDWWDDTDRDTGEHD